MKNDNPPPAAAPAAPAQPDGPARYDQGYEYGKARYVTDTTPPANDGGVVQFAPSRMNDAALAAFSTTENAAIDGNAGFTAVLPAIADVAAAIAALNAAMETTRLARIAEREATSAQAALRLNLDTLMKARAAYVQQASNGNTELILSAGFNVRRTPTPVGELHPPIDLLITLNGTPGVMFLSWKAALNARAYNIQCSPANTMAREWSAFKTSTVTKLKIDSLTLGQVYAFRIAAVGGAGGQSDWSAEVVRMAA